MRSYATARLGRVVPAYFVCLFLCWKLSPSSPDMGLRIGSAVTFTNWMHWKTYFPAPINAALWSIGIEVWFYAMLPVWALGLRACSSWRSSAFYWGVTQLLIVGTQVLILNRISPWSLDSNSLDSLQLHAQQLVPSKNPLGLFSHFLFGSAAAACLTALAGMGDRSDADRSRWNRFDLLGLACLGALAIVVHPPLLLGAEWSSWVNRAQIWAMHYQWPLFPALTAVLLVAMHHSKLLGRLFDNWLLSGICKLSYGIYLWHMVVLKLFCSYCPWSLETLTRQIAASFVSLSITVLLAGVSYRLIELPVMELLKRRPRTSAPRPQLAKA
jgi:peptidoglycan/LPS O-acetylase OafA/YrhL